ncbi:MAG: hypothetical protein ACI9VI_002477 [Candidatus Azotimanducaceae bacterium]|jgi:uncharacterized protein YbgA (DUF1722 family)/uncharacterized protein YbbK (DUF523 family)
MEHTSKSIRIGISSCLLGENVRFDSGHKKNAYITGTLSEHFDFVPFCPEVEIGLGTPREPIRLVNIDNETRCVGSKNSELDVTEKLYDIAEKQKEWHQGLCGYILKKDSPSCGMDRVRLYKNDMPSRTGVGLYAKQLMKNFPHLPIEEEGRLGDARLRENFIQRVYIYSRWKIMSQQSITIASLQAFHASHKYIFMSHDQNAAKALGAQLSGNQTEQLQIISSRYFGDMMSLLKVIATKKNHVNTLQHLQGYLKKHLDAEDKQELTSIIKEYHQGLLPIIVPITLLRHHFRRHPNDYISNSFYMSPHPSELMLLNTL